jgi:hypothetical protein
MKLVRSTMMKTGGKTKCRFCNCLARYDYGAFISGTSKLYLCNSCKMGLEEFFRINVKQLLDRIIILEQQVLKNVELEQLRGKT